MRQGCSAARGYSGHAWVGRPTQGSRCVAASRTSTAAPSFQHLQEARNENRVFSRRSVRAFAASDGGGPPVREDSSRGPGLIKVVLNAPLLAERYFERKWWRKPLWYFLTFGFAFFAANTISLSFGAKAVNDVVASVLVVIFYEAASRVVHKAKKRTVWHNLLHYFKVGTVIGFLMDSYKLGS